MKKKFKQFSLRAKLLSVAMTFAMLIVAILAVVQAYYQWSEKKQSLSLLKNQIDLIAVSSLEKTLWEFDKETASHLVKGIVELEQVNSVSILDNKGDIYIKEQPYPATAPSTIYLYFFKHHIQFNYPLYQPDSYKITTNSGMDNFNDRKLGELNVYLDHKFIWNTYIYDVFTSIFYLLFLVCSLLVIIERTFYFLFTKPLEQLSKDVSKTDFDNIKDSVISIENIHAADELGILSKQFNSTLNNLFIMKEELYKLATIDPVTNLPNRNFLNSVIDELDLKNLKPKSNYTVLLMDLDGFKEINDFWGHATGDLVLKIVGKRIKQTISGQSHAFRLGGDEFVIIYNADIPEAHVFANIRRLLMQLSTEICTEEKTLNVTASIGVSFIPRFANNKHSILKQCDIAMYEAKKSGGNIFQVYAPCMEDAIHEHAEMKALIQWAIDHSALTAFYQAKVCAISKKVVGYELLVRILNLQGETIMPGKFIEVAEKTRQIIPIGRWVLKQGIKRFFEEFQFKGIQSIAINVSLIQLTQDSDFVDFAGDLLSQYHLPAKSIELEITENFLIKDDDFIAKKLTKLQAFGFSIALDDFGTGYSSLSCIKDLPINTLKIDRSFVMGLPKDNAIPLTIISLAKNLGLSIVAEGVETEKQSEWLTNESCTYLQGYLFGKPMLIP